MFWKGLKMEVQLQEVWEGEENSPSSIANLFPPFPHYMGKIMKMGGHFLIILLTIKQKLHTMEVCNFQQYTFRAIIVQYN